MNIRKMHKYIGISFSFFFLVTAITGIILLFRKTGLYSKEVKSFLLGIHNWESGPYYIGIILGMALVLTTISGILLFFKKNKI